MPLKNHAPDAKRLHTLYCFIMLGLARNHLLYYNLEHKLPSGTEEWLMLPCVPSTTPDLWIMIYHHAGLSVTARCRTGDIIGCHPAKMSPTLWWTIPW